MAAVAPTIATWLVGAGVPTWAAGIASNLLLSVASSALQRALGSQKAQPNGIKTDVSTAGEATAQSLILGLYATAGNHVCPPMTLGRVGKAPNGFLTYVLDVGDAPINGIDGIWIDDTKVSLGAPEPAGSLYPYHLPVTSGKYAGQAWFRVYDGTQTTVSDSLTPHNSGERPWRSDMIGIGIPYVICRFRYNDEVYRGLPKVLFEVRGTRLYDPRKDASVGGSGTHRWADPATWEWTRNPAVMIYNILRGIRLPDGTVWGGEAEAEDLPLANWFAAANACDQDVGGKPAYQAGLEVKIGPEELGGDEPAAVIEELLRACSGAITEFGGIWKMRAGGPGLPVAVLTDDDIIITDDQTYEPFPGLAETYNAVHAQYPEPAEQWVSREAPPRYDASYEASDDNRRLPASLSLAAVPDGEQVQRLMLAWLRDGRRMRRHTVSLPPDYAALEPLDTIAWTSARNGYNGKLMEVGAKVDRTLSLEQRVSLREVDPADYSWQSSNALPVTLTSPATAPIAPQAVPGWAVSATVVRDASGAVRRPGLMLSWDPDQGDARGINWQVRVVGRSEIAVAGTTLDMAAGAVIVVDGILPGQTMEARGRLVVATRATEWSAWASAAIPANKLGAQDVDVAAVTASVVADLSSLQTWIDGAGLSGRIATETAPAVARIGTTETELDALGQTVAQLDLLTQASAGRAEMVRDGTFALGLKHWPLRSIPDAYLTTVTKAQSPYLPADTALRVLGNAPPGYIATLRMPVVAGETVDLGMWLYRPSNGPIFRFYLQWRDVNDNLLDGPGDVSDASATGNQWPRATVVAPAGAVRVIAMLRLVTSGAGEALITSVSARRRQTFEHEAIAQVQAVSTAQASTAQALADYQLNADARLNRYSASGQLRVTAEALPSGAVARVGLRAATGDGDNSRSVAMFLEARSDGTTQALFNANRFAIVDSDAVDATRKVPFLVSGGKVFLGDVIARSANIEALSVKTLHVEDGALTGGGWVDVSGTSQSLSITAYSAASRLLIGFSGLMTLANNSQATITIRHNGSVIYTSRQYSSGEQGVSDDITPIRARQATAGVNTAQVQIATSGAGGGSLSGVLFILEDKK